MKTRAVVSRRVGRRVSRGRGRWWLVNGSYYDENVEGADSLLRWIEENRPRPGAAKKLREWSKRISEWEYGVEV